VNEESPAAQPVATDAAPPLAAERSLPPPWGFWTTAAWTLISFAIGGAIVGGGVLWLNWNALDKIPEPQEDAWFSLQLIAINAVQIAVLAAAARLRGWPAAHYLGLTRPRGRDIVKGFLGLVVVLGVLEILTHLLGRQSVTPFQTDAYRAAQATGVLALMLMWLAFVVAAPVGEEVVFRGFLFRGWAASRLGVVGTIVLSALIFSAAHTQYDWFGVFQTFCLGALFAWLRWRSGSTAVTILLHVTVNFVSTVWTALVAQGLV